MSKEKRKEYEQLKTWFINHCSEAINRNYAYSNERTATRQEIRYLRQNVYIIELQYRWNDSMQTKMELNEKKEHLIECALCEIKFENKLYYDQLRNITELLYIVCEYLPTLNKLNPFGFTGLVNTLYNKAIKICKNVKNKNAKNDEEANVKKNVIDQLNQTKQVLRKLMV